MNIINIDDLDFYTCSSVSEAWIEFPPFSGSILNVDYVPTEVEILKREIKELETECYEARLTIEHGDLPDATKEVIADLHTKVVIYGRDPMDVVEELFQEHGMTGTCHQFGRVA